MYEASIQSHEHRDNSGLIAVIRSSIEPLKVFRPLTEPGRGTARDRKELADEAHLLLRSTGGNVRDMPINERMLQGGGFASRVGAGEKPAARCDSYKPESISSASSKHTVEGR